METVGRRELNHSSGRILDKVIATGEPIRVVSRDGSAVIISPERLSPYEQWLAAGLVAKGSGELAQTAAVTSDRDVLADLARDRDAR